MSQSSALANQLEVWADTDPGRVREGNEDNVYPRAGASRGPIRLDPAKLEAKGHLVIVADGVGGVQAGARISERAVQYVSDSYYDGQAPDVATNLRQAVESANLWLHDLIQRDTSLSQAATTVTAAVIEGNTLTIAHVGDSRAYLLRQGTITQLTADHTLAQEKADAGRIRPEQIPYDADHSTLTRSLGVGPHVQVDVRQEQVGLGDVVLLCSDGLYDEVEDDEIRAIAARETPKKAVRRLIALANRRGGHDNISVAVVRIPGGTTPAVGGLPLWQRIAIAALVMAILAALLGLGGYVIYRAVGARETPEATVVAGVTHTPTTLPATAPAVTTGTPDPALTATAATTASEPEASRMPTSTPITLTPTATARPQATPAPSSAATRTPTRPQPTPTQPTRRPAPLLRAPKLEDAKALAGHVEFAWDPAERLGPGEAFQVLIWQRGEAQHNGAAEVVTVPRQTLNLDQVPQLQNGPGEYLWSVVVVMQMNPKQRLSDEAPAWQFTYVGPLEKATKKPPPEKPDEQPTPPKPPPPP
jgi:serine/threonine protein phosphatase PrpC